MGSFTSHGLHLQISFLFYSLSYIFHHLAFLCMHPPKHKRQRRSTIHGAHGWARLGACAMRAGAELACMVVAQAWKIGWWEWSLPKRHRSQIMIHGVGIHCASLASVHTPRLVPPGARPAPVAIVLDSFCEFCWCPAQPTPHQDLRPRTPSATRTLRPLLHTECHLAPTQPQHLCTPLLLPHACATLVPTRMTPCPHPWNLYFYHVSICLWTKYDAKVGHHAT